MDFQKLMQWMEAAKKYQSQDFWSGIFDQSSFEHFMKNMASDENPQNAKGQTSPAPRDDFPPVDVYIAGAEIILLADLAGYNKEDLDISVSGSRLLISGTRSPLVNGTAVIQERFTGDFKRTIQLPEPTDSSQIRAKFRNGLLMIAYPRQHTYEERINID
ncbi:Hsp20/alpha crystallin family protein [Peribacillus kribbensis]|uniref:Hsp20/alpha crystallin family protein n=1 Tax=Peribacillus kribbensis TaxID=356658 RepID=UPI00041E1AF8|nr:Hsp20/alpha crystallin family protein [Peribacillus kribbensis]